MPFTFEPFKQTREGSDLVLHGRVLTGEYFGAEMIVLRSTRGEEFKSHIESHGVLSVQDWPVIPEHRDTVLILRIGAPPADFQVALITGAGAGTIWSGTERVDVTNWLAEPEFWAFQATLRFATDEVEDPGLEWFGIPQKAVSEWHHLHIEDHLRNKRFPYIRSLLPDFRYLELEMARGVEYQDRVWIGHISGSDRELLGYHSGHFSLPALRTEEASWFATQTKFAPSGLLWLSAAYLEGEEYLLALAEECAWRVPGLRRGRKTAMAKALLKNVAVEGLSWTFDSTLGWVNNWRYSQRNPKSALSILKPDGFTYIREFFG